MNEGWNGDDYLILFAESEREAAESRNAFSTVLPEFTLIGLRGWDDFIVQDKIDNTYCIPTVPVDLQYLSPFVVPATEGLTPDARFTGGSNGMYSQSRSAAIPTLEQTFLG